MLDLLSLAAKLEREGFEVNRADDWDQHGNYVPVLYVRNHASYRIRERDEAPEAPYGISLTRGVVRDVKCMQRLMDESQLEGNDA